LNASGSRSETPGKFWNVVLEHGEEQLDQSCEKWRSITWSQEAEKILHEISKRKANWIGHILRTNSLLQQVIEKNIKRGMEVTGRRGIRRRKLLDDVKERTEYSHLKEEALDRIIWTACFGRGFGPVVRQTAKWMNEIIIQKYHIVIIWIYDYTALSRFSTTCCMMNAYGNICRSEHKFFSANFINRFNIIYFAKVTNKNIDGSNYVWVNLKRLLQFVTICETHQKFWTVRIYQWKQSIKLITKNKFSAKIHKRITKKKKNFSAYKQSAIFKYLTL
jgi:hypothetical protein